MAITITPYTCTCEKKRINKQPYLTAGTSFSNGVKMEPNQDIKNPEFIMTSTTEPTFNYCYINVFNRYYYVVDKTWVDGNVWRISCAVDPLYSFKTAIYNLTGVAGRLQDQAGFSMIIDDKITTEHTQPEDVTFYELSVSTGKKGFNIQDSNADHNLTFCCFAGEEQTNIGLNSLDLKNAGGTSILLTPTFSTIVYYYDAGTTSNSSVRIYYSGTSQVDSVSLVNTTNNRATSASGSSSTTGTIPLVSGANVLEVHVTINGTPDADIYTIYVNYVPNPNP